MERMTIKFESQSENQGTALVHVFLQALPVPMIRTQVRLDGLPNTKKHGHEVTVNFHSDVKNHEVFYTDSNGLEMQERMLNYRPSYELDIMEGGLNVTANFYPINSAITLQDLSTNLKMAVVNDRAQAGSVLQSGRVELMMNRRIFKDDDRGVNEPLNECNHKQVGITV